MLRSWLTLSRKSLDPYPPINRQAAPSPKQGRAAQRRARPLFFSLFFIWLTVFPYSLINSGLQHGLPQLLTNVLGLCLCVHVAILPLFHTGPDSGTYLLHTYTE